MAGIKGILRGDCVFLENSSESSELNLKESFGYQENGIVVVSLVEAAYLVKKGRVKLIDKAGKVLPFSGFLRKAGARVPGFRVKSCVFSALRDKGYIVKSGFKFGADFLAYSKGKNPGKDHSDWAVFCVSDSKRVSATELASKSRVANTTKKRLLLAFVDSEGGTSFYEVKWQRI